MSDSYKRVLERADEFFSRILGEQRGQMQCGRGCSLCCYGLFEIGSGDVPVIAEGLAQLHPMRRKKIIGRAVDLMKDHPNLRESTPLEKEAFFSRTTHVPCPCLSDAGECMIYESRPLICRTFGIPLREGERYVGDVCELNFNDATDAQKLEASWDLRWEDELGPEDAYTVPEVIVLVARLRGWLR